MIKPKTLYSYNMHCMDCKCTFYWLIKGPIREIAGKLVGKRPDGTKRTLLMPVCPNCRSKKLSAWEYL